MPDSIFDLKQTLFTSSLPVPTPRDRGSDKVNDFDQALNSAQRQSRDEHRASNSPEAPKANERKSDDTDLADDASHDDHDEVTLSKQASEATNGKSTEVTKGKKTNIDDGVATDGKQELSAEEIAAATALAQAPAKPVLKQLPQGDAENGEQPEGIELNDAVSFGNKRGRPKTGVNDNLATNAANDLPVNANEQVEATVEASAADANAVVIATELHSTKLASEKKIDAKGVNKTRSDPAESIDKKRASEQSDINPEGEHDEGAFAVTVATESTEEEPAPKRRLETTQQTMPEVHEGGFRLAESMIMNAESTASAANPDVVVETTSGSTKTPDIPAVSTTSTESATPPNHLRGPQIPGSFANRLEAASNERKANDGLNGVDRTRFVQRVARAFQRAGETEGEIRLRLSPPELGAVKLEISLRDGAMIARMETETTTARNLLMDNLPQLKEKLAEQNVRIETFEVEVRDQSNHSSAEDAKEQLREQQEQQRNRLRGERATAPVVAAPIVRTLPAARQSSQLNVII